MRTSKIGSNGHGNAQSHVVVKGMKNFKTASKKFFRDARGQAGRRLANTFQIIRKKSTEMNKSVGNYISERPIKSLGIAMLAGLVVGLLMKAKRRRK